MNDDRISRLRATRDRLQAAIEDCESSRDLAALSREYRLTMAELDTLAPKKPKESPVDEIARRRAARKTDPPGEGDAAGSQ
jgi:hypothetical protein